MKVVDATGAEPAAEGDVRKKVRRPSEVSKGGRLLEVVSDTTALHAVPDVVQVWTWEKLGSVTQWSGCDAGVGVGATMKLSEGECENR